MQEDFLQECQCICAKFYTDVRREFTYCQNQCKSFWEKIKQSTSKNMTGDHYHTSILHQMYLKQKVLNQILITDWDH